VNKLITETTDEFEDTFRLYPKLVKAKLSCLRKLIIEVANELEDVSAMEETLKWGEPSFLVKKGSTIRMDWKKSKPDQYAMYFKCTSKLVPSFKAVFGETFNYEGNRAIVFQMNDIIPENEMKACIKVALRYHSVKHMPNLGM